MKKLFYHSPLLLILVFFSLQGFGQTDTTKKKSLSPLLDKYYTRPKEDTVAKKPVIKSSGVQQRTVQTPAPVKQQPIEEKRLAFPTPVRPAVAVTPAAPKVESTPVDSVVPVIAATPVVVETPVIIPLSTETIVAETKVAAPISDTTKIVRPVITSTAVIPPKAPVGKAEAGFKRPRLGSSSPLYNTYEKNNNGAGSVTTLPKR